MVSASGSPLSEADVITMVLMPLAQRPGLGGRTWGREDGAFGISISSWHSCAAANCLYAVALSRLTGQGSVYSGYSRAQHEAARHGPSEEARWPLVVSAVSSLPSLVARDPPSPSAPPRPSLRRRRHRHAARMARGTRAQRLRRSSSPSSSRCWSEMRPSRQGRYR